MAETIASHVTKCLGLFRSLVDSGSLTNTGVSPINPKLLSTLQDELSRFKVWSGNMGAHKTGTSSLDYRLRDATHISDQVLNLLRDLNALLKDATDIASGEITPWDELEEDPLNDQEESDADSPETELEQIAIDVADVVNCLLRLNADIKNPAPHQRFVEAANTDTPFFVRFDTQHVHAKFADIQPWLAGRLGEAISRRRQYFRYRQSHHAKLAAGLDEINPAPLPDSETVASSIPLAMKEQPGASAPTILQDNQSDAGVSQTSYATSAPDSGNLKIPPLPKEAYKGPFECPFCFMIIIANDRASWKKHVYSDLKPYTCLAEDCVAPEHEFSRRHEWMEHTQQNHWHTYKCLHGCEAELDSPAKCRNHLKTVHNMTSSQSAELDAFVQLSEQPLDVAKGIACPLCQDILYSIKKYQQHVGRHQEQLSLFALPSVEGEGSEDEEDEEINSNEAGSVNSAPAEQSALEMVDGGEGFRGAEEEQSSEDSDKANNSPAYHSPMSVASHGSFELGSQNETEVDQPEGMPLRKDTTSPKKHAYESSDDESVDITYRHRTRDKSPDSSSSIANQENTASGVADGSQSVSIETETPVKVAPCAEVRGAEPAWAEDPTVMAAWVDVAMAEATKKAAQDTIKKNEQPVSKPQPDDADGEVGSVGVRREKGKQKEEDKPPDGDGNLDYHSTEETARLRKKYTSISAMLRKRLAKRLAKLKELEKFKAAAEKRAAEEGDLDKAKEAQRVAQERAKKEAADKELRHRLVEDLRPSGLSETDIEAVLKKEDAKRKAEEQEKAAAQASTEQLFDGNRPTFTRMSLRHLDIETLAVYKVDWECDSEPGYILIKRWVPEWEQNMLWEHTRKIRMVDKRGELEKRKESETSVPTLNKTNDHLQVEDDYKFLRRGRRRSESPSLLMYLAGARPA